MLESPRNVDTKAPPPNAEQAAVEAIRWEESGGRKQVVLMISKQNVERRKIS